MFVMISSLMGIFFWAVIVAVIIYAVLKSGKKGKSTPNPYQMQGWQREFQANAQAAQTQRQLVNPNTQAAQMQNSAKPNVPKNSKMTPQQRQKLENYRKQKQLKANGYGNPTYTAIVSDNPEKNAVVASGKYTDTVAGKIADADPKWESQSILGELSDLMVKGYDGDLGFCRDFLGEAMDTISSYCLPPES